MASPALGDFNPLNPGDLAQVPESVRQAMRQRALAETFYLATMVLGFDKFTPSCHGPLCVFVDTCQTKRRMEQMPRDHFKTSAVTVAHKTRLVLNDPALRILIVGDTGTNAQKHLKKIAIQFERNRLLRWLFPERCWEDPQAQAPVWSKEMLYLPTVATHGEPTFDTIGARGAAVSRHYNVIDADDIIGEDEFYSPTEMDRTIEWFTGLESLFSPPINECLLDMPCTFWRTDDVYAYAEEFYGGRHQKVKTGPYSYVRGEIAVFRRGNIEDGKVIFPEGGFTMEYYDRLREKNPERYAAQYANNPFSADNAYFRPEYLKFYNLKPTDERKLIAEFPFKNQQGRGIQEIDISSLNIVSMCDPHAGGAEQKRFRGTRGAVITTGIWAERGYVFLLDCWIKRAPTDQLITEIIRQNEKWMPQVFSIEANGLQKMIRFWLDERIAREKRYPVPYQPYIPQGDKHGDRRIRGLQPLFRAGQIFVQAGFNELIEEYHAYPRGSVDGLDCLSQGIDGLWDIGWESVADEAVRDYEYALMALRSKVTGY